MVVTNSITICLLNDEISWHLEMSLEEKGKKVNWTLKRTLNVQMERMDSSPCVYSENKPVQFWHHDHSGSKRKVRCSPNTPGPVGSRFHSSSGGPLIFIQVDGTLWKNVFWSVFRMCVLAKCWSLLDRWLDGWTEQLTDHIRPQFRTNKDYWLLHRNDPVFEMTARSWKRQFESCKNYMHGDLTCFRKHYKSCIC